MSLESRLPELYDRALELDEVERDLWLRQLDESDAEAAARLRRLLAATAVERSILDQPAWSDFGVPEPYVEAPVLAEGQLVGAYRVVSELGRGGMASVYLSERADGQFEQRVALKILERPAYDQDAVRRFHLERQILADLDHPNIARLLDGGIAADGRPYFAMELVDGQAIDRYCDERALSVRGRLELFAVVGRAVAAAHRQLVVHRDLKPSNILVSREGVVKLLDFGIAKLLAADGESSPKAALTHTAVMVLTPEYASPEQLAGRPVTTASDVYQLGLLLYELLVGARPFSAAGVGRGALEPSARREPTRPSAAVSRTHADGTSPERAQRRGCRSLAQLRKQLAGDLDTIVLAALRPEPERRYESVSRLVEDVELFLANQPIRARPESWLYRGRKFVARHRWAVVSAAAAIVAVFALSVYYTLQVRRERDRAERQAARAEQVSDFLVGLFRSSDPFNNKEAASQTALQLLDRGAEQLESQLDAEPEVKAALLHTLATVYSSLVETDRAERLIEQAIALRRDRLGEEAPETLDSLAEEAAVWHLTDRNQEALQLYRIVLAGREKALGPQHPKVAATLLALSEVAHRLQLFEEAYGAAERARQILEQQQPPDPDLQWSAQRALAMAAGSLDRGPDALEHFAQALRLLRGIDAEDPRLGALLSEYAVELWTAGRLDQARPAFAEAVSVMERAFGPESARTEAVRLNAALAELEAGDAASALAMLQHSLGVLEHTLPPNHFRLGIAHHYLGAALGEVGRPREGLEEVALGRGILVRAFGESSPDVLRCDLERVTLLHRLERGGEARDLLDDVRARAEAAADIPSELFDEIGDQESALRSSAARQAAGGER